MWRIYLLSLFGLAIMFAGLAVRDSNLWIAMFIAFAGFVIYAYSYLLMEEYEKTEKKGRK